MFVTFVALGGECFLWLSQREFAGAPLLVLEAGSNFQQSIEHLSTFGTAGAELGVGLTLGPSRRSSGHMSRALACLMAPELRDRCRAIARRTGTEDGLKVAAGWVEQLAEVARR